MTEEEGDQWIALAVLHGPSTITDISENPKYYNDATHDPITNTSDGCWWVYRTGVCSPDFKTRAEASRHYCLHYNIKP